MVGLGDLMLYALIPNIVLIHLSASPYTKVEESFHIQATHDILTFGIPSPLQLNSTAIRQYFQSNYDHFTFPGAVPRTFIGALGLATTSWPIARFYENVDKQILVRAVLGLFNALSLITYARGIQKSFGNTAAHWYLLFQASQFHIAYYASRTLSNMFAFGITTLAFRLLLPEPNASRLKTSTSVNATEKAAILPNYGRNRVALVLFTIAGIIFRSELALLLAVNTIYYFLAGRLRFWQDIVPAGVVGLFAGLAATVIVDSYFWQEFPLWPEFSAFKFNVISGQASAWGVDPWYFYLISALPRLLLNPLTWLVCIPTSLTKSATRRTSLPLLVPSLAFVAIYSFQPHKEWRFIIYIIPALTAVAGQGAAHIWNNRRRSLVYRMLSLLLVLSTAASFAISTFILLPVSSANYPGAEAIQRLHAYGQGTQPHIVVHMGNLACQTGVTRFLQEIPPAAVYASEGNHTASSTYWEYDKTEDTVLKSTPKFWAEIDYALLEDHELEDIRSIVADPQSWEVVDTIVGFGGFKLLRPGQKAASGQDDDDDDDDSSSVEINAIKRLAGREVARYYTMMRDRFGRRLTRGYWLEMSLVPKIRLVKHSQPV